MTTSETVRRVTTPAGDPAWQVTDHAKREGVARRFTIGPVTPEPERAARYSEAAIFGQPVGSPETERREHAQMRSLLAPSFSAGRMARLRPRAQELVDGLYWTTWAAQRHLATSMHGLRCHCRSWSSASCWASHMRIARTFVAGRTMPPTCYANAEIELDGATIAPGDLVLLDLQDANLDSAMFATPQQFQVERAKNPHLSFGHGAHYCIDAPLARIGLQAVFDTLLRRSPRYSWRFRSRPCIHEVNC